MIGLKALVFSLLFLLRFQFSHLLFTEYSPSESAALLQALKEQLLSRGVDTSTTRDIDGLLVRDDFLLQCLRVRHWDVSRAAHVARNFILFRQSEGWPFHITIESVLPALMTGVHWVCRA